MNKDIVKNSIVCLSNMKIEDTTYQIARDIVLQELEEKDKEIERLNNITNELEKTIISKLCEFEKNKDYFIDETDMKELYKELQELKDSDKE